MQAKIFDFLRFFFNVLEIIHFYINSFLFISLVQEHLRYEKITEQWAGKLIWTEKACRSEWHGLTKPEGMKEGQKPFTVIVLLNK